MNKSKRGIEQGKRRSEVEEEEDDHTNKDKSILYISDHYFILKFDNLEKL